MRNFITYDWLTLFTIIGLFAIVIAKYTYSLRFNDFLYVVGNSKYLKIYSRDQKFIDQFDSLLFINLAISASIFIYFGFSSFIEPLSFDLAFFLKILFAISAVIIIKILVERLIGSLFEIDAIIDDYLFQKTTFKNYCGLILLIANLFLLYFNTYVNFIIIAGFSAICIISFIGFLGTFKTYQKLLNFNYFYFLLYLCALEIGPYVLLYKVLRDYNA